MRGTRPNLFSHLALSVLAGFFVGCTKSPEIPNLSRRAPTSIEKIVLDDTLDPQDIRDLFQAVNTQGKLDSLKPYLLDATDEELRGISDVLTRQLYHGQGRADHFITLAERRIEKKSLSQWYDRANRWVAEPGFVDEGDFLLDALKKETVLTLAERDSGLLNPRWLATVNRLVEGAKTFKNPPLNEKARALTEVTPTEVRDDVQRIVGDPKRREEWVKDAAFWEQHYFATSSFRALRDLFDGKKALATFAGFEAGLSSLLMAHPESADETIAERNQLDHLLHFAAEANQNTQNFFKALGEQLISSPGLTSILAATLRKSANQAVAGVIRERLSDPKFDRTFWQAVVSEPSPSAQFNDLYKEVLKAVELYSGRLRKKTDKNAFLHNLPLHLNSFAIARWLEFTVKKNLDRLPKDGFAKEMWGAELTSEMVRVNFVEKSESMPPTFPLEGVMTEPALAEFAPQFRKYVENSTDPTSSFRFRLTPERTTASLDLLLRTAVSGCDEVNPFVGIDGFLQVLVYQVTRPEAGSIFTLKELDNDSLMDSLDRLIALASLDQFRAIKKVLFKDLGLGVLTNDDKTVILDLFSDPQYEKTRAMVLELLNSVHAIELFDEPAAPGLVPPFETFYALLQYPSKMDVPWISSFLSALSRGYFSEEKKEDGQRGPAFPAIYKGIARGGVGRLLYALSQVREGEEQALMLGALERALGSVGRPSGVELHLNFLGEMLAESPSGALALIARAQREGWSLLPGGDAISPEEYRWVLEFLGGDHRTLWRFFKAHGSVKSVYEFAGELLGLCQSGELVRAFDLLQYIPEDRMKEIARLGKLAVRSGEAEKLLRLLQVVLRPFVDRP